MMNRGIENSRRFRALPLWFTLTAYGQAGIQKIVEDNCDRARELAEWMVSSHSYESDFTTAIKCCIICW
jgi:glutamate/tyrosine decarboxylase-like PLP-dependent enzyme